MTGLQDCLNHVTGAGRRDRRGFADQLPRSTAGVRAPAGVQTLLGDPAEALPGHRAPAAVDGQGVPTVGEFRALANRSLTLSLS